MSCNTAFVTEVQMVRAELLPSGHGREVDGQKETMPTMSSLRLLNALVISQARRRLQVQVQRRY